MFAAIVHFFKDILRMTFSILRNILVIAVSILLLLLIITGIGSSAIKGEATTSTTVKETIIRDEGGINKIVLVPLSGLILSESSSSFLETADGAITPNKIQNALRQAKNDPLVKAIIFDINSPGGSPVASDRIYEMIVNFKRDTAKTVVFLMGDLAASGGYYIASSSDHIVANPATITGSIGVILETYNLEDLYKKIGVAKNTFKQGQLKDMLSESRPITEEEQKIVDALNENTYNLFISRVAEGRKMSEEEVRVLATGQVYSGRQAKDLRLVDSLGNFDEAVYQAKSLANLDRFQVVEYTSTSVFKELFGETRATFFPTVLLRSLLSLPSTIYQQR